MEKRQPNWGVTKVVDEKVPQFGKINSTRTKRTGAFFVDTAEGKKGRGKNERFLSPKASDPKKGKAGKKKQCEFSTPVGGRGKERRPVVGE